MAAGEKNKEKNKRKLSQALLIVSLLLIVGGVIMLATSGSQNKPPTTAQSDAPKTHKPSQKEIDEYQVAADTPRYIYIPDAKVGKTRVMHLGINNKNEIAVPGNINDAGWYTDSSKPGRKGAMFIYGHISSWEAKGIFYDLNKLQAGNEVTVESGDGHKYTYKVIKTKTYDVEKVNMNEVLTPVEANTAALNLMTCTGKVKPGTSEFTERFVVFTTRV